MSEIYEELLERKFLDLCLQLAQDKWPKKGDLAKNFTEPVFGAADARKTTRELFGQGIGAKPRRRLKLAEALAMSKILGIEFRYLISDADMLVREELVKR